MQRPCSEAGGGHAAGSGGTTNGTQHLPPAEDPGTAMQREPLTCLRRLRSMFRAELNVGAEESV